MATNPDDITLDDEDRRLLAEAAERAGKPWRKFFRGWLSEFLSGDDYPWAKAQESSFAKVWDNDEDAVYDEL